MKTAFILATALVTLATSSAFAEKFFPHEGGPVAGTSGLPEVESACRPTATMIVNVLIQASKELGELKAQQMDWGTAYFCEKLNDTSVKFTFHYRNCGLCFPPKAADLEIVKTVDPQLADAPPSYTSTLKYLPAEH